MWCARRNSLNEPKCSTCSSDVTNGESALFITQPYQHTKHFQLPHSFAAELTVNSWTKRATRSQARNRTEPRICRMKPAHPLPIILLDPAAIFPRGPLRCKRCHGDTRTDIALNCCERHKICRGWEYSTVLEYRIAHLMEHNEINIRHVL